MDNNHRVEMSSSLLDNLFGFLCSGYATCSGFYVRELCVGSVKSGFENYVVIYERQCSGCTVDFVEKMWISLWASRWKKLGKSCAKVEHGQILSGFCGIKKFFAGLVEKFYRWIYTCFYLCKSGVLHSFHRAYYYDY